MARLALRRAFPVDREIAALFASLGLNVDDLPDEDEDCQAAVATNGGMAHIYLRRRDGAWFDPPRFAEDVAPVAQAFGKPTKPAGTAAICSAGWR